MDRWIKSHQSSSKQTHVVIYVVLVYIYIYLYYKYVQPRLGCPSPRVAFLDPVGLSPEVATAKKDFAKAEAAEKTAHIEAGELSWPVRIHRFAFQVQLNTDVLGFRPTGKTHFWSFLVR